MRHLRLALIILGVNTLLGVGSQCVAEERVNILIPAFNGGPLGRNVGSIINLKIWRTLFRPQARSPNHSYIGGTVYWSDDPLPDTSYDAKQTEEIANRLGVKVVLWGSIVNFGDSVFVQPLLAILPKSESVLGDDAATWTISTATGGDVLAISVGLPRRHYDLPPFSLSHEQLQLYATSSKVKVYRGYNGGPPNGQVGLTVIGELGDSYTRITDDGDYSLVELQNGKRGWVYIPKFQDDADFVDFVGGLIRVFRQDYSRAISELNNVSTLSSSAMLRVDSLLIQALASVKMERDPSDLIDSALRLNPYLQVSVKFKIMNLISQIQRSSGDSKRAKVMELLDQLSEYGYLFAPEDEWLETGKKMASEFESQ